MKPTAEKASTGEWYGVVTHCRKELYRTATTSLDKATALKRARNWMLEQHELKLKESARYQRRKTGLKIGDKVLAGGKRGEVIHVSSIGLIDVILANGVRQSFLNEKVKHQ